MKNRKSILIVDDEELFGTILMRLMEKENYVVSFCDNPSDALLLSQKRHFDIIVTDYDMPVMNGADFARLMRSRFADSFIVGLSCETRESTFLAAGANAFLEKPVDFRKLISMIRQENNIPIGQEMEDMISV
jgi:two-component system cell cycle response regulator DivK